MKQESPLSYQTLAEQYRHWGFPTDLIRDNTEFTIFNLAELHQPLPFQSPISRVNFFAFLFIKDGRGHYRIDEQEFAMHPGTVYFTNPGHYRNFVYEAIGEVYLITLSESFLRQYVHANIYGEFPFLLAEIVPPCTVGPAQFAEFERLYLQIEHEYRADSSLRLRLIGQLFGVLLLKLKEHLWLDYNPLHEGSQQSKIVQGFKSALEKHYRDLSTGVVEQAFRVQDYAEALHLHPNYLSNVISSKTGKSVGFWIAEKTIAEAKALLQHSALPIKEIAYRLGFAEPAHFSNYFKKHTQLSPGVYRKEQ